MFDGRGHLWVSDDELNTIQRFDGQGNFVECLGEKGFNAGEFTVPDVIALSAQGDLLVCDMVHNRVAVFGLDGRFLHMVPAAHDQHNIKFDRLHSALPSADGNIIMEDLRCVRLFSSDGLFLKEVKPPELGSDEHWCPDCLCAGPQGEFVTIEDDESGKIFCMRDADCGLLWSAEVPELNALLIKMDHKGRLICLSYDEDVYIREVGFHDGS
jgi:hypothetical protein